MQLLLLIAGKVLYLLNDYGQDEVSSLYSNHIEAKYAKHEFCILK